MEEKLLEIASKVLKREISDISLESLRSDIPTWDSFAHLALVQTVEMQLGIEISIEDVAKIEKLADFFKYKM